MTYPAHIEEKLGFDRIRLMLQDRCMSQPARDLVNSVSFSTDLKEICCALDQSMELRDILLFGDGFPAQDYFDMREGLRMLAIRNSLLEPLVLMELRASLQSIMGIKAYLEHHGPGKYPELCRLADIVRVDPAIVKELERILDEKGMVRDDASPELSRLRKERARLLSRVEHEISSMMLHARKSGWVADDAEITIRNGRWVIPVLSASKKQLKGLVHDRSATGHTLYIEPQEIFEANNEIRELELAEEDEIRRILTALADSLRPMLPELTDAYQFLAEVDLIRAKAKFALELNAHKPLLNDAALIEWFDATHPLLFISHKLQGKSVVPLKVKLDAKDRILVISGPNAGGKSVALKTIALLQYMLQCGLPVPMRPTSETGIFHHILLDIGDEQSLENDLSTYSSHLLNMKHFLEASGPRSLFLIDEFGAGTEPRFGGALAEAILEKLHDSGAFGVITTHYANLKVLANRLDGVFNGSMQFDVVKMEPMFVLETGNPGSSFAFEIASRIGLPMELLDQAIAMTGKEFVDFDRQLQQMENDKREIKKKQTELRVADSFLSEMIDKYMARSKELESKKAEIISEAKKQARSILEESNRLVEQTIRDIKESQADRERTRELRTKMADEAHRLMQELTEPQPKTEESPVVTASVTKAEKVIVPKPLTQQALTEGDKVQVIGQDTIGEVMSIKGRTAEVAFASMKMRIPLERLQRPDAKDLKNQSKIRSKGERHIIQEINEKMANFNPLIDLRGMRAEESLYALRSYMDDVILLNISEIRILHGKGDGILRQVVRDFVSHIPEVKQFRDEQIELGGHGITVVRFRD